MIEVKARAARPAPIRGRKLRRGVQLWKVAGAVFKSETYRFLRLVLAHRAGRWRDLRFHRS